MIRVLFFAQFKELLDCEELKLDLNKTLSVSDLLAELTTKGDTWRACLEGSNVLVAVNQTMATMNSQINDNDEVAIFPPVTGG